MASGSLTHRSRITLRFPCGGRSLDKSPFSTIESTLRERPAAGVPPVSMTPELRAALERRADDCWDRLEDAVSELVAVHEVPTHLIFTRIRRMIEAEGAATP